MLTNLLDNALRHTPTGGHVTITIDHDAAAGTAVVRVRDDGSGIPEDELEAVFERFHRADPARVTSHDGGSGLGLTIARAIMHTHGGTITATNNSSRTEPGLAGATQTVALPAAHNTP